jgi:hypothetical protein
MSEPLHKKGAHEVIFLIYCNAWHDFRYETPEEFGFSALCGQPLVACRCTATQASRENMRRAFPRLISNAPSFVSIAMKAGRRLSGFNPRGSGGQCLGCRECRYPQMRSSGSRYGNGP